MELNISLHIKNIKNANILFLGSRGTISHWVDLIDLALEAPSMKIGTKHKILAITMKLLKNKDWMTIV